MTALREQVARVVTNVMDTIKVSGGKGDRIACIDLDGCPPFLVSSTIMATLHKMGYIALLTLPGGQSTSNAERLYIDLQRKRPETVS